MHQSTDTSSTTSTRMDTDLRKSRSSNFQKLLPFNLYLFKRYETSDGSSRQEEAMPSKVGALVVRGSYTWLAPDGQTYTVNYVADENGFRPEAVHLPK